MQVHVSFQIRVVIFSRYVPRTGIIGSHGNSNFLRHIFYRSIEERCAVARPGHKPLISRRGKMLSPHLIEIFHNILTKLLKVWNFFFFSGLLVPHPWNVEVPKPNWSCSCRPSPQPQQAGSPTHWARPGIELVSSGILVRFISAAPQQKTKSLKLIWLKNKKRERDRERLLSFLTKIKNFREFLL